MYTKCNCTQRNRLIISSRERTSAHTTKGSFLLLVFIKLANVNTVNPVSVSTFRSVHVIDNYCTKVLREHAPTSTNHISPKNSPRCQHAKSPIAQNTFRSIPGLISCAGVARRWGLLSHAQNAVRRLALIKRSVSSPQKHHLFVQLLFMHLSFTKRL